ncbi:hypothetical protein [Winogradskyella eximia]|jgi:hypothetical protein|uniref:hypothetical protein n=1 Tax=Winogradskyella eximia TaxID=262006 RepID=UPI0024936C0B|nr:hypothetical protein [Winogradskyella eximia]
MNIFLKLKHWQIFLIWIIGTIQMSIFIKSDLWFLSFGLYIGLFLGWIYSIGKVLNKNVELNNRMKIWWILYLISLIPFAVNTRDMLTQSYDRIDSWIIAIAGIIGLVAITKIVIFSAKALKKAETKTEHKTTDLILEIFFIFLFTIGIWVLQPRLNKLISEN